MNYENLKPFTRDTPVGTRLVVTSEHIQTSFKGNAIANGTEFTLLSIEDDYYWLSHKDWGKDRFNFSDYFAYLCNNLAVLPKTIQDVMESSPHYHIAYINSALEIILDCSGLSPEFREKSIRRALEHGRILEKLLYEKI